MEEVTQVNGDLRSAPEINNSKKTLQFLGWREKRKRQFLLVSSI